MDDPHRGKYDVFIESNRALFKRETPLADHSRFSWTPDRQG
jgi:hypothetical protein